MAMNFPTSPTNGQTYTDGNSAVWTFNGTTWKRNYIASATGPTGPTGPNLTDIPLITSVIQNVTTAGATITLTIGGNNFTSGITAYVGSIAASTTFISSTSISASFSTSTTGTYLLTVFNSDGGSGFYPNAVTVT